MEQGPDERSEQTLEGVTAGGHSPAPSEAAGEGSEAAGEEDRRRDREGVTGESVPGEPGAVPPGEASPSRHAPPVEEDWERAAPMEGEAPTG